MKPEVIRTREFVADAAGFIVSAAELALQHRNEFRIALSGGNTPRPVYAALAEQNLPWDKFVITFGDERCVPPDEEQSNYKMARQALFTPAGVPDASILRLRGEIEPAAAANEYEARLDERARTSGEKTFRHDLLLLGMGDDGHTASLFPATPALEEKERRVVANYVPKFQSWRLTMTYPLLNQARQVCFLVDAKKNPELIEKVIGGDTSYPSARVQPVDGRVTWILGDMA